MSLHLVDPQLHSLVEEFEALKSVPIEPDALRKVIEAQASTAPPMLRTNVIEKKLYMPGPSGPVELLVFTANGAPSLAPGILFIHGGGYIAGSPESSKAQAIEIAAELKGVVVCARYRLAPECPAPGPLEDCYAALKWLWESSDDLGIDQNRVGVWGVSAGGGLAAALCLLARDRGEVPLAAQLLNYPMLDDRTVERRLPDHFGVFVWTRAWNKCGWEAYLGHEAGLDDVSQYASPARAEDLSGLPPTMIATASLDLFLDENMTYAHRLLKTGIPTEVHVAQGAFHAFETAAETDIVKQSMRKRYDWLRRVLKTV